MSGTAVCEFLEWDSEFFRRRIARVNGPRLTEELARQIEEWCELQRIECLYFLADAGDRQTVQLANARLFRFVDVRMTLDRRTGGSADADSDQRRVRDAVEEDIPELRALVRGSHRDSRFYHDGNFCNDECDRLYEVWIEKSCRGWADRVLVAEEGSELCGYLTCHLKSDGGGQIGLLGVSEKVRGKGIGTELLCSAMEWFARKGTKNVNVVTQGRNVPAQRFYQRRGFVTQSVEFWFHRWFPQSGKAK
jgi:ribosomal protein S18 acetylase RimI-like enzyme